MKHYLELVPISAKLNRRQSRMSALCITLAVLLATAIFGMADVFVRSQILKAQADFGNWHICLNDFNEESAEIISLRQGVSACVPYGVINYGGQDGISLSGVPTVLAGSEAEFLIDIFPHMATEGSFPAHGGELMLTENAKALLSLKIGDSIELKDGNGAGRFYTVCGFCRTTGVLASNDCFGAFALKEVLADWGYDGGFVYYLQFSDTAHIRQELAKLKEQLCLQDEQISENVQLLGLLGQSRDSFMMAVYASAGVLTLLVLAAGALMIASSLGTGVARRTEFYGLLRCLGATPGQVMRLVRREAFFWCRLAIPAGLCCGVLLVWIISAALRLLSPEYFAAMPRFALSLPALLAGALLGLLTVFISSRTPAKRAAAVSPLAAVSGSASPLHPVRRAANTGIFKIETTLGIHHALAGRKNFLLTAGSFAFSIILFLSFSVTVDFISHSLRPLRPWTPDLSIISADAPIDEDTVTLLSQEPTVKTAYGRMAALALPMSFDGAYAAADLISYEQTQLDWAEDYLLEGSAHSLLQGDENAALLVYTSDSPMRCGDAVEIEVGGSLHSVTVVGLLSSSPFVSDNTVLICGEACFKRLTGRAGYDVVDIQLHRGADEQTVLTLRQRYADGCGFSDRRLDNSSVRSSYYCMWLLLYGFLALIALITVFQIINCIAMSVSARTRQYGIFRAVGMSGGQLSRMIAAEAISYAIWGLIIGSAAGLCCNRLLFMLLVGRRWGEAWSLPLKELAVIVAVTLLSLLLSVRGPARRIKSMSIVETLNDR